MTEDTDTDFDLREDTITDFDSKYKIIDEIGRGGFGVVNTCCLKKNYAFYAVKRELSSTNSQLEKEFELLRKIQNYEHVVHVHKFIKDVNKNLYLVMELADSTLANMLKEPKHRKGLSYDIILDLTSDLNHITRMLQDQKIVHRDIKPDNILMFNCRKGNRRTRHLFKVCDLGVSREADKTHYQTKVGTVNYFHPHVVSRERYSAEAADLWSIGATLFYSTTGFLPFDSKNSEEYEKKVLDRETGEIYYHKKEKNETNENTRDYGKKINNNIHDIWFNEAMSCLIRQLFDNPTFAVWDSMVKALREAIVYIFFLPYLSKLNTFADLSKCEQFKFSNQCSLNKVVNVNQDNKAILLSEHDIRCNLTTISENFDISPNIPYFVLHDYIPQHKSFNLTNIDWQLSYRKLADKQTQITAKKEEKNEKSWETIEKERKHDNTERIQIACTMSYECQKLLEQERTGEEILHKCFQQITRQVEDYEMKLECFTKIAEKVVKKTCQESQILEDVRKVQKELKEAKETVIEDMKKYPIQKLETLVELYTDDLVKLEQNYQQGITKQDEKLDEEETKKVNNSSGDGKNLQDDKKRKERNENYDLLALKIIGKLITDQKNCETLAKKNNRNQADQASAIVKFNEKVVKCKQEVDRIFRNYEKTTTEYIDKVEKEFSEMDDVIRKLTSIIEPDQVQQVQTEDIADREVDFK